MTIRPRIYLAGPEVFLPNARVVGKLKADLCADAGFEGAFPLDQELDLGGLSKLEKARRISLANEALMRSCDLVIANMTPFRGISMDAGTAFEMGFMRALGRPVLAYSNTRDDYRTRADIYRGGKALADDCDQPTCEVEDFGLADNLMMAIAVIESSTEIHVFDAPAATRMTDLTAFAACLADARRLFHAGTCVLQPIHILGLEVS